MMPELWFEYLVEDIPTTLRVELLQAYLDKAGRLGWKLKTVREAPGGVERYIFSLRTGMSHGTRPDRTW